MNILYRAGDLPELASCNAVVCGGSFGGVAAALALARAGRRVTLVEPRTYLGREMTATLRPWLQMSEAAPTPSLPELIDVCLHASAPTTVAGESALHMDSVKTALEDLLLEAGVRLIYASLPVGVISGDDGQIIVIIGNKSGRQALRCQVVIDATETALLARLAGAEFEPQTSASEIYARTLEFTDAAPLAEQLLVVPPRLGLVDNQVVIHRGYRDDGHYLVEYRLALPGIAQDALQLTERDRAARQAGIELAAHLLAEVPAFNRAYLAGSSHELHGRFTVRLAGASPAWTRPLALVQGELRAGGPPSQVALASLAGPIAGLWLLNEAVRLDTAQQVFFRDPLPASEIGNWLGSQIHRDWEFCRSKTRFAKVEDAATRHSEAEPMTVREPVQPQRGRAYGRADIPALAAPVLRSADVLVVGGGTSGATAALASGERHMHTVLVEMNPGLGGTGTYGGIYTYWYGRRVGFAARVMQMVDAIHDKLRHDRQSGPLPTWNIEAKIHALMLACADVGVEMALNSLVIGTVVEGVEGNVVRGVVIATRFGPAAMLGRVVIDASGDGDVAAYAGAEYVYGAERDHVIMYSYMAQVAKPGRPRNVKTSMVDITNIEDYTRAILAERRRKKERDHDHGIYMAPRESRHIRANVVLTLTDQLLRRCWPDVVNIAFSNNDIKGQSHSDWVMIGLISPNLEIEIPYRALLPKGLENIIVAGKAFSATHDALAAPRMQPDIENLGAVAGIAAAMAVQSGRSPRTIDVKALQAQLVEVDVLPQMVLTRVLAPLAFTDAELRSMILSLPVDRPLHAYSDMELNEPFSERIPLVDALCVGPQVVPQLEEALEQTEGPRQLQIAMALAMVGSNAGVPIMITTIKQALRQNVLPKREARIRHAGFPPDQNAAPDIAYVLHALGLACDQRTLAVWQRVVELLATTTEEAVLDKEIGHYYYAVGVCFGAERLGDPAAVPILQQLHSYAPFRGQIRYNGVQSDYLQERLAYLELVIGRALARCGSPAGFVPLISYLEDPRAILAEHAHTELIAITGKDFGKDMAAWEHWLEMEGENLQPKPWRQPSDPVRVWGEVIYTMIEQDAKEAAVST